ncbi:MAG: 3-deoxy-8-phosphooctulonate synthase [Alphaproteobacteria bacterium]|nr:3-deoxy-8-phosphooctulonate synthase [Alphaproteobacteria bacterium]
MISQFNFLKPCFHNQRYLDSRFFLIAGPCVVESFDNANTIAQQVKHICEKLQIPYIFKASYKKANRTSKSSFMGLGDEAALKIIQDIGKIHNIPTITDIHSESEADMAADYVDILQIPAFLCRQTELLQAAARTHKIINIKKGQFLNAEGMKFALEKVQAENNLSVMLTERGNSFGYQDLVVDFRNLKILQNFKVPVIMDCTHAIQQPNNTSGITLGTPQFIETIARAAVANQVDGIFLETHPNPREAKSDGANMIALDNLEALLKTLVKINDVLN